jgi:hypothetical protein
MSRVVAGSVDGLCVERRQIMRWPGHSMEGPDAETVSKRKAAPCVVHWAGLKRARQRDMTSADLLAFFEKIYSSPFPAEDGRRLPGFLVSVGTPASGQGEDGSRKFAAVGERFARFHKTYPNRSRTVRLSFARNLFMFVWTHGRGTSSACAHTRRCRA